MNKLLHRAAFGAGLLAIGWIAAGLLRTHPLALAMTLLIAAAYLAGAAELRRFRAATDGLLRALDAPAPPPGRLDDWLAAVPEALRPPVRLRIEGERAALPGPAMAPYLTGLLVLLGMLGTFLGMVVTLNGTGLALAHASDLTTMRDALAAPVRGLGLAFGTSVAGVAASAMLGLMSALARRERIAAAQRLDTLAATTLRPFGAAHRRDAKLQLLQDQAALAPALVERLDALGARIERQNADWQAQLLAGQQAFHERTAESYRALAASVDRSLQASLADGARAAAATIQPVVEATMAGIAREAAALHGGLAGTVQQQLDTLAARLDASARGIAAQWQQALAGHEQRGEAAAQRLQATLDGFGSGFARRADGLLATLAERHAAQQADSAQRADALLQQATAAQERAAGAAAQQLGDAASRLDGSVQALAAGWQQALAQHARLGDTLAEGTRASLAAATATFERQATALQQAIAAAQSAAQAEAAARDEARQAAWAARLDAAADTLQQGWQAAAEAAQRRDEALLAALSRTADTLGAQAEAQATRTIGEAARLLQAAAEAPRAAAEVIVQLREQVSAGLARDDAMLEERTRMLDTLTTLLDAVRRASGEQQAAIDALVASSAEVLAQAAARFGAQVEAEGGRLADAATQIAGSAVEVASLGDAFGAAVAEFGAANGAMVGQLQRIEAALGKTLARSDDQLAYYVAQAREVIDLSVLSQQRVVEELQRLGVRRAPAASEA